PLVGLIVFLGVYPKPVIERMEPSVNALIEHMEEVEGIESPTVGDRPEGSFEELRKLKADYGDEGDGH
ncbi:MAG: hypothetical protein OXN95_05295, partial [bacterium]|nr:hypothetical protein [bacterium]